PFRLRSSSSAQRWSAFSSSVSIRSKNAFRAMITHIELRAWGKIGYRRLDTRSQSPFLQQSLIVQRSRVQHRLGDRVAAQHHKQVANHGGPTFRVEIDDLF